MNAWQLCAAMFANLACRWGPHLVVVRFATHINLVVPDMLVVALVPWHLGYRDSFSVSCTGVSHLGGPAFRVDGAGYSAIR
jgi:hypothetical protein